MANTEGSGQIDLAGMGAIPMVQEQAADALHDGAPGGPWFSEAELPVVPVLGGQPMTTGGYSPDPSRTPQGSSMDPPTLAPSGLRR